MKKTYIAALAALLLTACGEKNDYDATGIFEATTVTVAAETAGKIMEMDVDEGDRIEQGSLIAQVDTVIPALQRKQVLSQQAAAEKSVPDLAAQLASVRSQIEHQEHECRRLENLLADGAATQKQVDDAQATLRTLRRQLDGQSSSLGNSRNSITENAAALRYQAGQLGEQIARCSVKSPLAGTVLVKYAEAGEYATPGKPLVKLADMDNVYLRSYFTAEQLADLTLGRKVTVIADFGGDKRYEYEGTITAIADESEFTPKSIQTADSRANLVYAVKVSVKNDGRLKLGQYGEVRL